MSNLKIYEWEKENYPKEPRINVCRVEQQIILRKLSKHFKIIEPGIAPSYRRGGAGLYVHSKNLIKMGNTTDMGTVIHEFAHHLEYCKYGTTAHRKRFKRVLKKVYNYVQKRNYWNLGKEIPEKKITEADYNSLNGVKWLRLKMEDK